MLERIIEMLGQKEVWLDIRTDKFVSKKDSFVAPEMYISSKEIAVNYSKFLNELDIMYKQLSNLK